MSKSRDIADSAATINYIDGLTSDAQGQLDEKATLDGSPTFTGTVTATAFSGDGSGLTGVDSLPSQSGQSGKFLTTDGSAASWDAVDVSSEITGTLPVANGGTGATILTANSVLLGNGTSAPLAVAPSTSGNVLTSNGTTWQSTAPASAATPMNLTEISGSSVSGSSSIEFTNLDNSYDYYLLFINDLDIGSQQNPSLTYSSNNGSTYSYNAAASGNVRSFGLRSNGSWAGETDSSSTRIYTYSTQVTAYTYIYGIGNSEQVYFTTEYTSREHNSYYGYQMGRSNNSTTNINAIKLEFGGTAVGGAVYLYGVTI